MRVAGTESLDDIRETPLSTERPNRNGNTQPDNVEGSSPNGINSQQRAAILEGFAYGIPGTNSVTQSGAKSNEMLLAQCTDKGCTDKSCSPGSKLPNFGPAGNFQIRMPDSNAATDPSSSTTPSKTPNTTDAPSDSTPALRSISERQERYKEQGFLNVNDPVIRDKLELTGLTDSQIDNKNTAFVALGGSKIGYQNIDPETKEKTQGQIDLDRYDGKLNFGAKGWTVPNESDSRSLDLASKAKQEALTAFGGDKEKFIANQEIDTLLARTDIDPGQHNELSELKTALSSKDATAETVKNGLKEFKENNEELYRTIVGEREDAFRGTGVDKNAINTAELEQNLDNDINEKTRKDHELSEDERLQFDQGNTSLGSKLDAKFKLLSPDDQQKIRKEIEQYEDNILATDGKGSEYLLEKQRGLIQKLDAIKVAEPQETKPKLPTMPQPQRPQPQQPDTVQPSVPERPKSRGHSHDGGKTFHDSH